MSFHTKGASFGYGTRRQGAEPPRGRAAGPSRRPRAALTGASSDRLTVGIGGLGVGAAPQLIITHALGSCVALCAYDLDAGVGGMLHFMLPDSRIDADQARRRPHVFLDLGLSALLDQLHAAGARPQRLQVKLIGGASLQGGASALNIGHRNVLAARKLLWRRGLMVVGEEVGGRDSRTAILDTRTGIVTVQTPRQQARRV